jgi:predicted deacylase
MKKFIYKKEFKEFNEKLNKLSPEILDHQICKIVKNPKGKHTICFIGGLHGNEIAGPYGILKFLESGFYIPTHKKVVFIPIANPSGFELRTRENEKKIDINRKFLDENLKEECKEIWNCLKDEKLNLLVTLHEDVDLHKFYAYYTDHEEIAEDIKDLAKKYFKIYDKSERKPLENDDALYGDKIINGLIPLPHTVRGTIEDRFLAYGIPYITTESPGKIDLKKRIEFNEAVIKLIINGNI